MRIRINANRRGSECVRRTPDAFAATVQHVTIDHRRRHVFVTQQFLNRTDVNVYMIPIVRLSVVTSQQRHEKPGLRHLKQLRWTLSH